MALDTRGLTPPTPVPPGAVIADRRLWGTADGRVVEDGDPDAQVLLASGPGRRIPADLVARFRIGPGDLPASPDSPADADA